MMVDEFAAAVTRDGDEAVIELHGLINGAAEAEMERAYEEADALDPAGITLDFGNVTYINSTGIALIVGLLARARAVHRPLSAVGLSDHYREIFTITRLSDFIEIR